MNKDKIIQKLNIAKIGARHEAKKLIDEVIKELSEPQAE
ncbi:unnamed protein product, partial [marine sediment metagenome]